MQTTTHQIAVPKYSMKFDAYKKNGQKMRKIIVYKNGQWIYRNEFKAEDKARQEQFAQNFLKAMKLHDTKQIMQQLDQVKGF